MTSGDTEAVVEPPGSEVVREVGHRLSSDAAPCFPFTALEDAVVHSERGWPITIHLEAQVRGHLDIDRARRALAASMADHPLTRVARAPVGRSTRVQIWAEAPPDPVDTTGAAPVEVLSVLDVGGDADLDEQRDRFLSAPISIDAAPLFRVLIARRPDHHVVMFSVHHGMCDGIGAVALFRSFAQHYRRDEPAPSSGDPYGEVVRRTRRAATQPRAVTDSEFDPQADPGSPVGSSDATNARDAPDAQQDGRRHAITAFLRAPRATRLTGVGGRHDLDGYHIALDHLDAQQTASLRHGAVAAGVSDATLNDLLLCAFHRSLADWNRDHAAGRSHPRSVRDPVRDLVSVTVPVTGRAADERDQVVANLTLQATTTSTSTNRQGRAALLAHLVDQTRAIKRDATAAEPAAVLGAASFLPARMRGGLPVVVSLLTRDRFVDTSRLSNLGRHDLADATSPLVIDHLWFSPPVRMPQGLTLGVLNYRGALHLGYRACRAGWNRHGLAEFVAHNRRQIDALRAH